MSQAPTPPPGPAPAPVAQPAPAAPPPPLFATPTWFDFLLLLVGVALSFALTPLAELRAYRSNLTPGWVSEPLAQVVPGALLLPLGVLLWWPIFYTTARFRGRSEHLTFIEYLWGTAWLLDLGLVGLVLWKRFGVFPGLIDQAFVKDNLAWVLGWVVVAFAGMAILAAVNDVIQRRPRPWTHHLGLALFLWPLLVLAFRWYADLSLEY